MANLIGRDKQASITDHGGVGHAINQLFCLQRGIQMRVVYKHFSSSVASWESLFEDAAAFATTIGKDRLIGISHSHGGPEFLGSGVVTVWYWEE